MNYHDELLMDFSDPAFQAAFRACFAEMGCRVTNWDGLFAGMNEVGRDYTWMRRGAGGHVTTFLAGMDVEERDAAWVRRDENGRVAGFIQFTPMHMSSWFFTAKCGFIREFWIAPEMRRQGHGSSLLKMAEAWLQGQGCQFALLTTDTAPDFYRRHGYTLQKGIEARNRADVFCKQLGRGETDELC